MNSLSVFCKCVRIIHGVWSFNENFGFIEILYPISFISNLCSISKVRDRIKSLIRRTLINSLENSWNNNYILSSIKITTFIEFIRAKHRDTGMSLENSDDRRYYTPRYTCKWGYKRVMPTIGSRYVEMSDYIWDVELRLLHWPSWPLIGPPKYIFR